MAMYAVLRSPMRYFDTNPIGILLNRFSKDTYYMDERFPDVFLDFLGEFEWTSSIFIRLPGSHG